MLQSRDYRKHRPWIVFVIIVVSFSLLGLGLAFRAPAAAAQTPQATPELPAEITPTPLPATYVGPEFCANCHKDLHAEWGTTRHSQAFSSPIFQQNWQELGSQFTCLQCHTTGYDLDTNSYATEGVTCEACHGPYQVGHPERPMPINPDAALCSTCHKTTADEWRASRHGEINLDCQSCHNPHNQKPKAESITALCTNCHSDPGQGFTHSTHASSGLECSSCHMYRVASDAAPIGGLVSTGHTFAVGSEACIGCHQDTVHTRDTILALSGDQAQSSLVDPEALQQQVQEQEATISELEARSAVRLYTGLAQGAIIGLIVGGVAAWIVSRRLRLVDVEEEEHESASD